MLLQRLRHHQEDTPGPLRRDVLGPCLGWSLQSPASCCPLSPRHSGVLVLTTTRPGTHSTHEAVAHHAAEPLERVAVSVGEVELRQLGVAEQGAQGGLAATQEPLGYSGAAGSPGSGLGGLGGRLEEGFTSSCCGMSCMISFWGHWSVSLQGEGAEGQGRPPCHPPPCLPITTHRFSP